MQQKISASFGKAFCNGRTLISGGPNNCDSFYSSQNLSYLMKQRYNGYPAWALTGNKKALEVDQVLYLFYKILNFNCPGG